MITLTYSGSPVWNLPQDGGRANVRVQFAGDDGNTYGPLDFILDAGGDLNTVIAAKQADLQNTLNAPPPVDDGGE